MMMTDKYKQNLTATQAEGMMQRIRNSKKVMDAVRKMKHKND